MCVRETLSQGYVVHSLWFKLFRAWNMIPLYTWASNLFQPYSPIKNSPIKGYQFRFYKSRRFISVNSFAHQNKNKNKNKGVISRPLHPPSPSSLSKSIARLTILGKSETFWGRAESFAQLWNVNVFIKSCEQKGHSRTNVYESGHTTCYLRCSDENHLSILRQSNHFDL